MRIPPRHPWLNANICQLIRARMQLKRIACKAWLTHDDPHFIQWDTLMHEMVAKEKGGITFQTALSLYANTDDLCLDLLSDMVTTCVNTVFDARNVSADAQSCLLHFIEALGRFFYQCPEVTLMKVYRCQGYQVPIGNSLEILIEQLCHEHEQAHQEALPPFLNSFSRDMAKHQACYYQHDASTANVIDKTKEARIEKIGKTNTTDAAKNSLAQYRRGCRNSQQVLLERVDDFWRAWAFVLRRLFAPLFDEKKSEVIVKKSLDMLNQGLDDVVRRSVEQARLDLEALHQQLTSYWLGLLRHHQTICAMKTDGNH